jgi:RES domain-containing protein
MEVFRLARSKFGKSLSGTGAALKGARWNSPGTELIYTAMNRSLAMAEVAVHFTLATLPADYLMMTLFIPDSLPVQSIDPAALKDGWNAFPHSVYTQKFGDEFVTENRFCLLKVPSAVTKGDFNMLINPHHPNFNQIKVVATESFPFDLRIFK